MQNELTLLQFCLNVMLRQGDFPIDRWRELEYQ